MKIISREQIKSVLPGIDLIREIEKGFISYSRNKCVVPPVGEMILEKGEVHIKSGYVEDEELYVIKIASGFYGNPALGKSSSNGMMILFRQETGEPVALLQDEGSLTDIRTAVAGAISAKHLAPSIIERIGIVGTGIQGVLQLKHLEQVTDCREVLVWGRSAGSLENYKKNEELTQFNIETTEKVSDVPKTCNLIVTTTPSLTPLLNHTDIRPGIHITAVGSDTPQKQELEVDILARADLIVADSIPQCLERGEIYQALAAGVIESDDLVELGNVIREIHPGRESDEQVTVADLTGVAVQDLMIAEAVLSAVSSEQ